MTKNNPTFVYFELCLCAIGENVGILLLNKGMSVFMLKVLLIPKQEMWFVYILLELEPSGLKMDEKVVIMAKLWLIMSF